MDSGLSSTEALLLGQGNRRGGLFGGDDNGDWVFFLFFLLAWGGNGFGFGNNGYANQINNDFLYTNLSNQLGRGQDRIENTLGQGFTQVVNRQFDTQKDLGQGFSGVQMALSNLQHNQDNCCCLTNRNIDAVRYEGSQNTCAITTNATANTQKILDKLCTMESNAKDQRIADLQFALQTANNQLSQQAQSANLISEIRPVAKPAYITCSPYEAASYGYGYGYGRGNGCGNSCFYGY